jgi:hypothetical protein
MNVQLFDDTVADCQELNVGICSSQMFSHAFRFSKDRAKSATILMVGKLTVGINKIRHESAAALHVKAMILVIGG